MAESLSEQKAALRAAMRSAVQAIPAVERSVASRLLCERLGAQAIWTAARSVLLFKPLADEPDIWPLAQLALRQGKVLALPRFVPEGNRYEAGEIRNLKTDLTAGRYGVIEPAAVCNVADLKRLDLILVPGVAFDWHGRRLGRGKGYYDRLLAEVSGTTCGVAFDQQLVATIPVEPHDVHLNCILTPSHWLSL